MKKLAYFTFITTFIFSTIIHPETFILQNGNNGYSGCKDTYLEDSVNTSVGNDPKIIVEGPGCDACREHRAILHYDLSSIGSDETIKEAVLSIYCFSDLSGARAEVEVYYLLEDWEEASATWFEARSGINWQTAGGYFSTEPITSIEFTSNPVSQWHNFTVTSIIHDFITNAKPNYGLLLMAKTGDIDLLEFISSESDTTDKRPKLTITIWGAEIIGPTMKPNFMSPYSIQTIDNVIIINGKDRINYRVSLIGLNGRICKEIQGSGKSLELDIRSVPNGVYIIKIHDSMNQFTKRVIIAR